jgi:hypothetical protein
MVMYNLSSVSSVAQLKKTRPATVTRRRASGDAKRWVLSLVLAGVETVVDLVAEAPVEVALVAVVVVMDALEAEADEEAEAELDPVEVVEEEDPVVEAEELPLAVVEVPEEVAVELAVALIVPVPVYSNWGL